MAPGLMYVDGDPAPIVAEPACMEREAICRSSVLLRPLLRWSTSVRAGVERYVKEFPEVDTENILRRYPRGLTGRCTRTKKLFLELSCFYINTLIKSPIAAIKRVPKAIKVFTSLYHGFSSLPLIGAFIRSV